MSVRVRIRAALWASLLGWVAGLAAGTPFQILEAVHNAGAGTRLLAYELGVVLALWAVLTFAVAVYWCGFFLLPVVWLASAAWIIRHRVLWITTSLLFGVVVMAVRLHVWTALEHDGVSVFNFFMWGVFGGTFCTATAMLYASFLRAVTTVV